MAKGCFLFTIVLFLIIGCGIAYWQGFMPIGDYDFSQYTNETHRYRINQSKNMNPVGEAESIVFAQGAEVAPKIHVAVLDGQNLESFTSFALGGGAKEVEFEGTRYPAYLIGPDTVSDPKTKKAYERTIAMIFVPNYKKSYLVTCFADPVLMPNYCNKITDSFEIY